MINTEKMASWMREQDSCLFCYSPIYPYDIVVRDEDVLVKYQCKNKKCSFLELNHGEFIYTLIHSGHAKSYENFMSQPPELRREKKKEKKEK